METPPLDRPCPETRDDPVPGSRRLLRAARPRRAATPAALALVPLGLALGALTACQGYEPRPLDSDAHRAAWHARTLEGASLEQFLRELDGHPGASADAFDPADGLSLREAQLVALVFHPGLRVERLRAGKAAAAAGQAGRWADPNFSIGALRITDSVPDPWVINPGLTLSIPLSGRLAAARDMAEAQQRAAEGALLEAEWAVWREVRVAWIEWSAAAARADETERFAQSMDGLVSTAAALAQSGEMPGTQAALFRLEQLQRQNQLRRLSGEVAALERRLFTLLGLAPDAPLRLVPELSPRAAEDAGAGELERRNPTLARLRQAYDVAEADLRQQVRKQYPDLILGPQYETDAGQSRVGLLAGFPVPFLNANRRAIAAARVERELARTRLETTREGLTGRWAASASRAASLASQREDMTRVLVPLVERQLEDSIELMQLGEGQPLVLLASLTRAFQTRLDLIETHAAEATARTELAYLVGPPAADDPSPAVEQNR